MRSKVLALAVITVLGSLSISICSSQTDTTSQKPKRLILADGSELIGSIVAEDSSSISFKTISGISMMIPRKQVRSQEVLSGQFDGSEYIRPDPNYTRLLFSPTAR